MCIWNMLLFTVYFINKEQSDGGNYCSVKLRILHVRFMIEYFMWIKSIIF